MSMIILKLYIILIYVNVCAMHYLSFDKAEGSSCNVGRYNGTYLNIKKCFNMIHELTLEQKPVICSFDGTVPIVCCTECSDQHVENIDDVFYNPFGDRMVKNGRKSWDKCFDYIRTNWYPCYNHATLTTGTVWREDEKCHRMLYSAIAPSVGNDVSLGDLPYMALLGYGNTLETAEWLCGGSLISESFILTAGHCISKYRIGPVQYAALGMLKRSDPPELWQRYSIKRIIPHPKYKSPSKYHDIALLETATTVKFSNLVLPACLSVRFPNIDSFDVDLARSLDLAIAAGWGALGQGKALSDALQSVSLTRFSDEECTRIYPPHRLFRTGYNSTIHMCYGNRHNAMDTCEGDSGGPLVVENRCSFEVIGVTSFGHTCGTGKPGMYTKVEYYVPWIESIVWP